MKSRAALRNLTLAALASLSLGGCYYGDVYGASYADADCYARYGDNYWSNEPTYYDDGYYGYDCYDAADYRSGFVQIGFGGGWYQQLYYPGYGLFLFDRYGNRHAMTHDYRTYWGGRRAWWRHHGHRYGRDGYGDGYRRDGHGGGYGRDGDGRRDGRHDGRRPGRGYGQGAGGQGAVPGGATGDRRWGNGPAAVPAPPERPRYDGRRDDAPGGGEWRGRPRGNVGDAPPPVVLTPDAPPAPDAVAPPRTGRGEGRRGGGFGAGGGSNWSGNGGGWTPPAVGQPPAGAAPMPEPRAPRTPRFAPPPQPSGDSGISAPPPRPEPRMAPPAPPPAPDRSYIPSPPPRSEAPRREEGGPIRED